MQEIYQRIDWENEPSKKTPINEDNLNRMDYALKEIDKRVVNLSGYEERAKQSEINAKKSEENAKQSELSTKRYSENAFYGTPDGYGQLVEEVRELNYQSQDGMLTAAKFSEELKLHTIKDYVTPQMFGAKGDGDGCPRQGLQGRFCCVRFQHHPRRDPCRHSGPEGKDRSLHRCGHRGRHRHRQAAGHRVLPRLPRQPHGAGYQGCGFHDPLCKAGHRSCRHFS